MTDNHSMLRAAHLLQLIAIALMGLGVVMIHSAGVQIDADDTGQVGSIFASRHIPFMALAAMVMFAMSHVDLRGMLLARNWTNPLAWVVLIVFGLCAAVLIPGVGRDVNGASRWLQIGGFSFQPSELMKYTLPVVVAWWCSRHGAGMRLFFSGMLPGLVLVIIGAGLVAVEDFGTGALIGGVGLVLLFAGGARWWHLGIWVPAVAGLAIYAVISAPYRFQRLLMFMDPWKDPEGSSYHIVQSMTAIANGGFWGRGLGNSTLKFGYLPEDKTDFIFAIICEELGVPGAALVITLYLALIWVGITIIRQSEDRFTRLIGLGIVMTIGLQTMMNLAVVTVVVPPKGIALPLVSAGGTGWIVTAAAVGLLASLDNARHLTSSLRESELAIETEPERRPALSG